MEEDFWKRDDEKQTYNTNMNGAGGGGRRSEGMTLPSVLVSEASGNSHTNNGLAERLRGQANGAAGGTRERDRDTA